MLQGTSADPAEDPALVAIRKQMIIQLGDLIPHVSVNLCQLPNIFFSFFFLLTNTQGVCAALT